MWLVYRMLGIRLSVLEGCVGRAPFSRRAAACTGRPAARATKETKANLRRDADSLGDHVLSAWL